MHRPFRRLLALAATAAFMAGCGQSIREPVGQETPATGAAADPATTAPAAAAPSSATPSPAAAPSATPPPEPSPTPSPTPKPIVTPEYRTGVDPVRVEIPAIDVDAAVVDLAIGPGDPEVPQAWEDAGWYTNTRNPGEIGPAVIAGHIDSREGPAVFVDLDQLAEGDEIIVHGTDGDSRTFTVRGSGQYPKEDLPDEVFGFGDRRPELRLITCGGSFDRSVGHYEDNLVVYAAQDI